MKKGLCALGEALDSTLAKNNEYSAVKKETSKEIQIRNLDRNGWLIRLIEFQFLAHPPLYWRIHMLASPMTWKEAKQKWMNGRVKESLPDLRKVSTKQ